MKPFPDPLEQRTLLEIRTAFCFPRDRPLYEAMSALDFGDYIRAFRAVRAATRYIEIGTYDKGNLGYLLPILANDATIIDIDIHANEEQAGKVRCALRKAQTYHQIVGNSQDQSTAELAAEKLGGGQADAVFIDASHTAEAVLTDYALYSPLVRPGGLVMFHDVLWTGDDRYLGVSQAIEFIDKLTPVYVVTASQPIYRFMPVLRKEVAWGGIGVIMK
jgi:predicted O-methyltransferase YrrM